MAFEKGAHGEAAGLTRWYQQDATPHSATSGDGRGAQGQRRAVRAGSVRAPAPGWQHRPASGSTGCLTDRAKLWGQPGHPMAGADTQGTAGTGGCQPAVNILSPKLLMQRPVVGAANGPCDTQEAPAWAQMAWSHRNPLPSQSLGSTEGWEDPMGPSSSPIKSPRAAAGCRGEGHQVASPGLPARRSAPQTVGFHSSWAVEGVRRTRCPCVRPSGAMDPDLWPLHGPRALLSPPYL